MEKETIYSLWTFFIIHAVIAAITNLFLFIINLLTFPRAHSIWFPLPLLIWGLIVFAHYYLTKLTIQGYFHKLKEQMIEKLNNSINAPKK